MHVLKAPVHSLQPHANTINDHVGPADGPLDLLIAADVQLWQQHNLRGNKRVGLCVHGPGKGSISESPWLARWSDFCRPYLTKVTHLFKVHGLVFCAPEWTNHLTGAPCQLIHDVRANKAGAPKDSSHEAADLRPSQQSTDCVLQYSLSTQQSYR